MLSLIVLGIIFIWPVFTPISLKKMEPLQSALYLFSACVGCTVLGIFITFAPLGLYTVYYTGSNASVLNLIQNNWGINSEVDQQMAGLIMWVPACFVYLTNIMIKLFKWYKSSEMDSSDKILLHKR
jgi:putative membrane protein